MVYNGILVGCILSKVELDFYGGDRVITKNNYKFGMKNSGESIETSIGNYIDNTTNYLVMGSYNFWMPKELFYKIKNVANNINTLVLFPQVSRSYQVVNSESKIKSLLNANVAVLISGINHSKFLFNESNIYFGSGNLTSYGLNYNIEAVTLYDSVKVELRNDFIDLTLKEIDRYLYNRSLDLGTAFSVTYRYFSEFSQLVLKLNPNIMKVEKTVNNYELCDMYIAKVIDMYFAILSFSEFKKVYTKLMILRLSLEELYSYGSLILHKEGFLDSDNPEEIQVSPEKVIKYNKLWEDFHKKLRNSLNDLETLIGNSSVRFQSDELALKNYNLIIQLREKLQIELKNEYKDIGICEQCGRELE